MKRLLSIIPPLPWHRPVHRPGPGDRIILLHGLWRSIWAMDHLASELSKQGFETLIVPYSSFRKSLDDIVTDVAQTIPTSEKPTHFVTHSMGGIVLRCLIRQFPNLLTGKVVMLAPPNQGSEIIDWLSDSFLGKLIFGPGGMALSTAHVRANIPGFQSEHDVTVVMGTRSRLPVFNFLLDGESDGIVTVESGKVEGMTRLETIDADHTFIMNSHAALDAILRHLASKDGRGRPSKAWVC